MTKLRISASSDCSATGCGEQTTPRIRTGIVTAMLRPGAALAYTLVASLVLGMGACKDSTEVLPRSAPKDAILVAAAANGNLKSVSRANGRARFLLDTFVSPQAEVGEIRSLVFHPAKNRFFAGSDVASSCSGCIYKIDADSGKAILLADDNGIGASVTGLAKRSDGDLFAYYEGDTLAKLKPSTGLGTIIGSVSPPGSNGHGITFDTADILYHADDTALSVLDATDGTVLSSIAYKFIGFPILFGVNALNSLTVHPLENRIYGLMDDGSPPKYLVTVNPDNGKVVHCGTVPDSLGGLAFLPPDDRFVTTPPSPPQGAYTFAANGEVWFGWEMSCKPHIYHVFYSTVPHPRSDEWIPAGPILHPPYFHTSLSNDTTFYYAVAAQNMAGWSDLSEVVSGTPNNQVAFIPFDPEPSPLANQIFLVDDDIQGPISIGFDFTFFGRVVTEFYISSNGFISFDAITDSGCCEGRLIPKKDGYENLVALAWTDLNPDLGGTISYEVFGAAPDRTLVVDFYQVPMFAGGTVTVQAILKEADGIVEFHTDNIDAGQVFTQGLENFRGIKFRGFPGSVQSSYGLSGFGLRYRTSGTWP